MPAIAAELVDLIISFLHPVPLKRGNSDDNYLSHDAAANVGKCALVCRAWVPSSRRVLFYRIHVKRHTAHGFATLFRRPQRLTFLPFIRELEFRSGIPLDRWMNSVLPRITKHLPPSVNTIGLNFEFCWAPNPFPRNSFPRINLSTITNLEILAAGASSLTLDLSSVVEFITSFPQLEGLRLWARRWHSTELPDTVQALRPAETLCCLDLNGPDMGCFLGWLHGNRVAVSTLRLSDTWNEMSTASFKSAVDYIRSRGSSLTSLALTIDLWRPRIDFRESALDDFLDQNTRLQTLSICAKPIQTVAMLKKAQLSSSLESIMLALKVTVDFGGEIVFLNRETLDAPLSLPPWSEIDLILSPLPSLKKLEIALCEDGGTADAIPLRFDEISAGMLQLLPLCAARGIVTQVVVVRV
ncbi:hypothetical protein B0H11DRAFT_2201060 [Mycena galericulata]|nr:hypothetical protein B0H11DRAFT_2201060 [Mycena galericulata]